jgi:hypothetical protein
LDRLVLRIVSWRYGTVIREEVGGFAHWLIGIENGQSTPLEIVELAIAEGPAQSQDSSAPET